MTPQASSASSDQILSTSQPQSSAPFSIATPAVTQINENLTSDASFLQTPHSYHTPQTTIETRQLVDQAEYSKSQTMSVGAPKQTLLDKLTPTKSEEKEPQDSGHDSDVNQHKINDDGTVAGQQEGDDALTTTTTPTGTGSPSKKKCKSNKKSLKLDTKSKLEKSRQSARECRARKKLRYQYLEDLVCNREKAVVKLREELTMFCQMSEQIDSGTISEKDRNLLIEQTKENSKSS